MTITCRQRLLLVGLVAAQLTGCVFFDKKSTPSIYHLNDVLPKALAGDTQAEVALANAFSNEYPWGGIARDPQAALRHLLALADNGNANAQLSLGNLYRRGSSRNTSDPAAVHPDSGKARYWFERAADQGNRLAYASLQQLYSDPAVAEADPVEACKWALLQSTNGPACNNKGLTPTQLDDARRRADAWLATHPPKQP